MKKIMQTEFGRLGNCQSACVAMMLGLELPDVPNWSALPLTDNQKYAAQGVWLRERGWQIVTIVPWQAIPWPPTRGYYIAGGVSPRGHRHSVIYLDGELWHDPHPEGGGITGGPEGGGPQDIDLIMPLDCSTLATNARAYAQNSTIYLGAMHRIASVVGLKGDVSFVSEVEARVRRMARRLDCLRIATGGDE